MGVMSSVLEDNFSGNQIPCLHYGIWSPISDICWLIGSFTNIILIKTQPKLKERNSLGNSIVSVPPTNVFPTATDLVFHNIIFHVGGTFSFYPSTHFPSNILKNQIKVELDFASTKAKK